MDGTRPPGDDWFDQRDAAPPVEEHPPWVPAGERPPAGGRPAAPAATVGGRRLQPAGAVLLAGLVAFALGLFLNAASLQRTAKAMPYGLERTVAVDVMRPVAGIGHFLFLDRPSAQASRLLGRSAPEQQEGRVLSELGKPSAGPSARPTGPPTAAHPLRVWVGGDSMAQNTGAQIVQYARRTGVMKATLDYHISTGLSRPDYYDWPQRLRYIQRFVQPDVAVAFFGANDAQPVMYEGQVLQAGSPLWDALYHRRVGEAMDLLSNAGRTRVYWVGLPIMEDAGFSQRVAMLDAVFKSEAATRPDVVYVDSWKLFATPKGTYADYLRTADGQLTLMRQSDGIHMTLAGASRQGWAIVARIARDYHASPPAP